MLNLIDQSDILKGLDDTMLQRELKQPSGGAPPFLVLSEISRRKDMRQRYAGELATRAPTTTVMEDVMSAPAMPGAGPTAGAAPGGIAAAAQMGGGGGQQMPDAPIPPAMRMPGPGYAGGGIVAAVDPNSDWQGLVKKYQSNLDSLPDERNRDAALALIQAGAGIMGAGHSNTLQNIGVGVNVGVNSYGDALKATDARETNALRGLSDLAQNQHSDALQRIQEANRMDPNSPANTPQSIREAQMIAAMPDGPDKDNAMAIAAPFAARAQSQVLDPATLDQIAVQYLAGDKSVLSGFGRSATARTQIANAISAKAAALGMDGKDIAAQMGVYAGNLAGQRAAGTRAAQVGIASSEANTMADLALTASKAVPRGQFVPFNQVANAVKTNTSSPEMAAFYSATMSLVNAYARAISPVGAPTDAMRQKAIDMLNTAQGPDAYAATIKQMKLEMEAALNAPAEVSDLLKTSISGDVPVSGRTPAAGTTSTNVPFTVEP